MAALFQPLVSPIQHNQGPKPPASPTTDRNFCIKQESFSPDISQRFERKLAQYNSSKNVLKCWLFEIISVATSALCIGAIIGILINLENQSLSKWPTGLTIITVLSKIVSAALILPISEAIGQLKWTWFQGRKPKSAFDFEIFDKASRGAWGSVLLLYRTKGRSLAALGAFLTLLLLAIDTFFQQVTNLRERWIFYGESLIPRSVRYAPSVGYVYDSAIGIDLPSVTSNNDLRRALTPFFYDQNGTLPLSSGNASQAEIPLHCPTSKCKWEAYTTLGVCSACKDVSYLLEYACLDMRLDWLRSSTGPGSESTFPNGSVCGYFLNATSQEPVLMSGYLIGEKEGNSSHGETLLMRTLPLVTNPAREPLYGGSINFKHINYPILDALIVSSADGSADSVYRKERPVAHECMLTWCAKTLRSSYAWGDYKEEILETSINTTSTGYPWSTSKLPGVDATYTDFNQNISIFPSFINRTGLGYGVSNDTFLDTVVILDEIFPSLITVIPPSAETFVKIRTSFRDKVVFRSVRFNPWLSPNNVTHHMQRIAHAMTNVVRSDSNSNEMIVGEAYSPETYVAVQWVWLTFPLIMLALSIIFLVSTIIKTSRGSGSGIGVWKTSAMPTLIYSLPKEMQASVASKHGIHRRPGMPVSNLRINLLAEEGWKVT